ncbi:hypothetical protein thsps117_41270 [Pseudomonas sp. No.117]
MAISTTQILLINVGFAAKTDNDYLQLFTTSFAEHPLPEDPRQRAFGHKAHPQDNSYSTSDLLPSLALLQAWTEGHPVLVFDEWAADQDPTFRRIFYAELLPSLKALGKTIIVISHDDRYFDCADQLVRLSAGQRVMEQQPA